MFQSIGTKQGECSRGERMDCLLNRTCYLTVGTLYNHRPCSGYAAFSVCRLKLYNGCNFIISATDSTERTCFCLCAQELMEINAI